MLVSIKGMIRIHQKKICVLGLGYIGLPTASLLATKGFKVHGVDINHERIEMVSQGLSNIMEPDLDILVKSAVNSGNLTASEESVAADIFMITVPTPFCGNHVPDLSYVDAATHSIAPYLSAGNLVILESTCPVGTTEKIQTMLSELRPDLMTKEVGRPPELRVYLAHCPERVLPGQILKELIDNDRIIGGVDRVSAEKASHFYRKFINGHIFLTTAKMAELSKLVENAFRDVNIAFANELSFICDPLHINVWELIQLANRHPRVNILNPGPGVGGHCIAVDPWFIVDSFPNEARLIRTAREINDSKPEYVLSKINEKIRSLKNPVIACLGLTFKANVSDLRESPALHITAALAETLAKAGTGRLLVVEPFIHQLPESLLGFSGVELVDLEIALSQADLIVLLVDHRAFRDVDPNWLKQKTIIDTRGIWQ
jgi:UDP-N-acetyl-D-mannosaminuronic acid dehydrogenase